MGEYLSQTGLGIQTQQREMFTPRGYDPLQEIYHWSLIIFLLLDEMIVVSITFVPTVDTVSFLSSQAWNIKFGIGVILLFLLVGIASPPLTFLRYRREKRRREMLRQAALMGSSQPLAPLQPPAALAPLSLPIRLESQLNKSFVQGIIIGVLLVILVLALDGIALLGISAPIQRADFLLNSIIPGLQPYLPTRADFRLITDFAVRVTVPDARSGRLRLALESNYPQLLPSLSVPQQKIDVLLANQAIIRFPPPGINTCTDSVAPT